MATAPDTTALRRTLGRLGPAVLAAALAALAWFAGLHGTDLAAQTYHADVVRLHGLTIWDGAWYGGSLPLSYSVASPLLGALFGIGSVLIVSSAVSAWAFDRIVTAMVGRRPLGSWYFAVSNVLAVAIGQVPYLTGETLALLAVLSLLRGHRVTAVVLGAASALLSPLAAAFLVLVCAVWAVHDPGRRRRLVVTAVGAAAGVGAVALLFPGNGPFPFAWSGLVVIELLCLTVLSPLVRTTPAVRLAAAAYGLASLASFVVPNPLGGNAARLAESCGIPLVACLVTAPASWRPATPAWWDRLRTHRAAALPALGGGGGGGGGHGRWRWRGRAVGLAALVPFVVWQWAPGTGVVAAAAQPASDAAAFYAPLVAELHHLGVGPTSRIEAVPTSNHWEAAYVAPAVGLARGWDRQLDLADNPIFYPPAVLDGATYRAWLVADGITWVALPHAPLDYAAVAEAALLTHHEVRGLTQVWSTPSWTLWRVDGSPGLVSGPAILTALAPDRVVLDVHRGGPILLRVHWTGYWTLVAGRACVTPGPGATPWTIVRAAAPGVVDLRATLLGGPSATCPAPG